MMIPTESIAGIPQPRQVSDAIGAIDEDADCAELAPTVVEMKIRALARGTAPASPRLGGA